MVQADGVSGGWMFCSKAALVIIQCNCCQACFINILDMAMVGLTHIYEACSERYSGNNNESLLESIISEACLLTSLSGHCWQY